MADNDACGAGPEAGPEGNPSPSPGPRLRIVSINDVYSLENLPRLRNLVEHHRTTEPADVFFVVLAGDFVAPSLLSSLDSGRGMVDCMKHVGVTYAIFGNHEDDVPIEELHKRISELGAVWLSTNLDFDPVLPKSCVVTVGRVRVGLLGVVMTDASAYRGLPFGGAPLRPPNEAAWAEAARLVEDEGCACVIPITHQPLEDDRRLAEKLRTPRFPVILGGHEHVVIREACAGTWIVKAGMDAAHAAIVDLEWPAQIPAQGLDAPTVSVRIDDSANYLEDAEMRARVDRHMTAVREIEAATLFDIPKGIVLSSVGARARQTSMGTFLCTVVGRALGAEGCLINGGGIRGAREYHDYLTFGDLKTELPFENDIVVVSLPGRVLRASVKASRALAPIESGSYLQVDEHLIVDAHDDVVAVNGAPFDEGRDYLIALVRELLVGLDRIEPLVEWAKANPEKVPAAGNGRETKLIVVDAFAASLWKSMGGFDAVDVDGDGIVTEAEVLAAMKRISAAKASRITAGLVLRALDANRDQVISRDEAVAHEAAQASKEADRSSKLPDVE